MNNNHRRNYIAVTVLSVLLFSSGNSFSQGYQQTLERNREAACSEVITVLKTFAPPMTLSTGVGSVELKTYYGKQNRNGCRVTLSGGFPSNDTPDWILRKHFDETKWTPVPIYDADGPMGTRFGYFNNGAFCLSAAQWNNGGLDDPPPTKYGLEIICVIGSLETVVE